MREKDFLADEMVRPISYFYKIYFKQIYFKLALYEIIYPHYFLRRVRI